MTAMFSAAADGFFLRTRCYLGFRYLKDPSRPMSVHYFSNSKAWMNSDIMETVL